VSDLAIAGDRRMTVKEVAEALGYEQDTIRKKVKDLFPESVQSGLTTYLTEAQVVAIKQSLTPRTLALKSGVEGATTDLEMMEQGAKFAAWALSKLKEQEASLAEAKPKVEFFDAVASSKDAIPMREAAAALNLKGWGRNNLFAFLRDQKILDSNNVPYREFQDRGYFRVVEQTYSDSYAETHVSLKTLVYQKGLDWIRKLIKAAP
jgi:phage antirepressor YoqD-like protein